MQHKRRKSELTCIKSASKKSEIINSPNQSLPINSLIKLKPFSDECTLDQIQEKLQTFRHTMQNMSQNHIGQTSSTSFKSRLTNIVKKSKKRANTNSSILEYQDEKDLSLFQTALNFKPIEQKKHKQMIKKLHTIFKRQSYSENKYLNDVRQKIDSKQIERAQSQFQISGKPKSQSLLINFNKNNSYMFSRSKQKVMQVQKQLPKRVKDVRNKDANKFQSFGNLFYRNYLKKYDERKQMLGPKGSLMKMVTQ